MWKQQSSLFSQEHGALFRKFIAVWEFQILVIRRRSDTIIPHPFQCLSGIGSTWKLISNGIVFWKAESCRLSAFVDNGTRHIQLQRIIRGVKNVHVHIPKSVVEGKGDDVAAR